MENKFSKTLIKWYKTNGRDLPWRRTNDPYLIWISEIILQQTRVIQGYEYYRRFVKRFPDVRSLADAEEDEVMKYWQGLGYYSRARNLHLAAKSIQDKFPVEYDDVIKLKGIGEYTAAAICSFAYNMPYAVVDGNVYRVLARYFGLKSPIDSVAGKRVFKELSQELLDKKNPGLYNQAIMDFGAIQCKPGMPDCAVCPLVESCYAFNYNKIIMLPVKQHKTQTKNRYFNYMFVKAGKDTFLNKRTGNDIWKNLYELPLIETQNAINEEELLVASEFSKYLCVDDKPLLRTVCKDIKHVLTHRIIYANFYEILLPENTRSFDTFMRVPLDEVDNYPVSKLVQMFFEKNL